MSDETHSPKDDLRDALRRSIELADRHRPPPCPACAENRELVEAADRWATLYARVEADTAAPKMPLEDFHRLLRERDDALVDLRSAALRPGGVIGRRHTP